MKTVVIPMVLVGLAAGAFGLSSLTGDKYMIKETTIIASAGAMPSIDTHIPARVETATFALG